MQANFWIAFHSRECFSAANCVAETRNHVTPQGVERAARRIYVTPGMPSDFGSFMLHDVPNTFSLRSPGSLSSADSAGPEEELLLFLCGWFLSCEGFL